ncbi:hypothetical protein ACFSZS_19340 [Seohaeicola zhoushanensis]
MTGRLPAFLVPALLVVLAACTRTDHIQPDTRVLAIGDSVLAWHGFTHEAPLMSSRS